MKIAIITVCRLKDFPPVTTMLKVLKELGHEVLLFTHAKDKECETDSTVKNFFAYEKGIYERSFYKNIPRGDSVAFWMDRLQKRAGMRRILRRYIKEINVADIVWVLHEDTPMLAGRWFVRHLPSYLYTMYELPFSFTGNKKIYMLAAKSAWGLVTPDYFRSHIMKAIYSLDKLPYVIPNKPYDHPKERNLPVKNTDIQNKLNQILQSGKKIIMYMGIMSSERPLDTIIRAVSRIRDTYEFVVVGQKTTYLDQILHEYEGQFTYLGFVKPPEHLNIASYAHVAYVSYVANNGSINAVFCAPNKVYEFAGFGIPMLCNDNPGLKTQVEFNRIGVCLSDLNEKGVIDALQIIDNNYSELSHNAENYYKATDLNRILEGILDDKT